LSLDGVENALCELIGDLLRQLLSFAVDASRHHWRVAARQHSRNSIVATVYWAEWHWLAFERFNVQSLPVKFAIGSFDGEVKAV